GFAASVTIEPVKDNSLIENAGGGRSNALGPLFTGRTGLSGGELAQRAVLEFDVAGNVPAGATITSAEITMNLEGAPNSMPVTTTFHRALAEWGEGTSFSPVGGGAASTTDDATWIHTFYPSSNWASAGGDYVATGSTSQSVVGLGSYTFTSAQLAADVQLFLDSPSQNHGWVVIGDETGGTARRWTSREGDPADTPKLTIVYDEGGEPTGACCIPDASATCNDAVTASACSASGGTYQGNGTTCAVSACPVIPTPFVDALPIPAVATPISGSAGGVATYDIAMREIQQTLHSELPPTTLWAYGDGPSGAVYPGPTIEATSDETVTVNWINDLRDSAAPGDPKPLRTDHLLPVDTCPHGAEDLPKAVVHLHGGHTPAESDGHPEETFLPGEQDTYIYPNGQLPATLWYHDHSLGQTRLGVYLGMAGFYLIRDAFESALGLPDGEYEVPLVIQDRSFQTDGSLLYPALVQEMFFGDTNLVNGRVWPFHDVKLGKYRFRVLNGANSRHYTLQFCPGSNASPCPSPLSFQLIGGDGGLLPAPLTLTEITLGPAERADVVVNFAPLVAGTEVYLVNSAPAPFPGSPGVGVVPDVMKFVVQSQPGFTGALPPTLRTMEDLDENAAVATRHLELVRGSGNGCSNFRWEIVSVEDGMEVGSMWVDIVEYPELDTIEVWEFYNRSGMTHPMHLHLNFFQVLSRQNFTVENDQIVLQGSPTPPAPEEAGWKDTILVNPLEVVRVVTRFEDYTGLFPYHCHILEHEDHEMMRQFQTIQCGNGVLEPTEECDDGNTTGADGCSKDCQIEDELRIYGVAQGGEVQITVDGILVIVPTSAGQDRDEVAQAIAAAIEADPTLSAAGVTAFAISNRVVTTGTIDSVVITDPGLSTSAPLLVPSLGPVGVGVLVAAISILAARTLRRRQ
ncbi:MAG: multicopper oxidase domain-containing protein, partial [Myxococcota bacterium]